MENNRIEFDREEVEFKQSLAQTENDLQLCITKLINKIGKEETVRRISYMLNVYFSTDITRLNELKRIKELEIKLAQNEDLTKSLIRILSKL